MLNTRYSSIILLLCFLFHKTSTVDILFGGILPEQYNLVTPNDNYVVSSGNQCACGELNRRAVLDKAAMMFAVEEVNKSDEILPGISLGVETKNSCNNVDCAIQSTLEYSFVQRNFLNSSQCSTRDQVNDQTPLVAIIAGGYSHIIKAIVNLVGIFKVPVIGFSSTSPSLNKIDYFLRTVPSDEVTARVMVDLVLKFNWNIVLLLHADTEFGHYAADSFLDASRRQNAKICIAFNEAFSRTSRHSEMRQLVDAMRAVTRSRVVVFFGTMEDFTFFQERTEDYFDMNQFVWVTSEVWLQVSLIKRPKRLVNVITVTGKQRLAMSRFLNYLHTRPDIINSTCLRFHEQAIDVISNGGAANIGENKGCWLVDSIYLTHALDAVYAVAQALHQMLGCVPGKSCKNNIKKIQQRLLLEFLRNISFTSPLTKNSISFDSNGNPSVVHYRAVKLEAGQNQYALSVIGEWSCNNGTSCQGQLVSNIASSINSSAFQSKCGTLCSPGEYKAVRELFPDCCWECKKCSGDGYSNSTGQMSCSQCGEDQWPNANHTACVQIHPEYLHMNSPSGILILIWDGLGIFLSLVVGVIFIKYKSSHIVRASSRQLSLLLLVGIIANYALLISLMTEPDGSRCAIIFVAEHMSSCLVSATLFLKTNRIHRIFRKRAMTERPRCLGNTCQLSIIAALVSVEVLLSMLNVLFYPSSRTVRVTYVQKENEKKAFALCHFFGSSFKKGLFDILLWSYDCGMIFICTYQAYLVRQVPENYNEARYITFTMVTASMNIIVLAITGSGMEGYNLVLVYCIFQSVIATVALGCMFFPKIYIIVFQPEKNVPPEPVHSQLGTFVQEDSTIGTKAKVGSDSSQCSQSVSSADSGTSSEDRGFKRSHRKVGVDFRNGGNIDHVKCATVLSNHQLELVHSPTKDSLPNNGKIMNNSHNR